MKPLADLAVDLEIEELQTCLMVDESSQVDFNGDNTQDDNAEGWVDVQSSMTDAEKKELDENIRLI